MCTCTPPLTFVKCQTNGSLTTHHISAQSSQVIPEIRKRGANMHFAKSLGSGSLTLYQISVQSIQPFMRYGKGAHLHVHMCRCTPPITCALCTATWSLNTHQIWSQSVEHFLSYSPAGNFDTHYTTRATCEGDLPPK